MTDEQTQAIWMQIIEAHFSRTDKGGIPNLSEFSTPDTAAGVAKLLNRNGSNAFAVALTIVEPRLKGRTAFAAELRVRGRLTIVEQQATASSEVFLSTLFQRGSGTLENPTGWRLSGIHELTREEFYSEEREAVRRETLGTRESGTGK